LEKKMGFKLTQTFFFNYSDEMDPNAKALFGKGFTRGAGGMSHVHLSDLN
jgi:hypothetical protein